MSDLIKIAYEDLANAVIIQAVNNYRNLLNGNIKPKTGLSIPELEKFFKSEWFRVFTNMDGATIMNRVRREITQ